MSRKYCFSFLSFFLVVLCLNVLCPNSQAQTYMGQWGPLINFPFEVTHAHLLPNGKVLMWPPYNNGDNPELWDPLTGSINPVMKAGYNIFCSGHSHLADGRLFVAGGQANALHYGVDNASIFDYKTNTWVAVKPMYAPRWYPTSTALGNGDVLVTSGAINPTSIVGLAQVWQHATGTWRNLPSAQLVLPLYPRMFLAPNGLVFYAGDLASTRYLNTSGTGTWTAVAITKYGASRDYGSAVQYGDGKIVIIGGGHPVPTAMTEVIDLTAQAPAWRSVAPMAHARRQLNATLLANGEILVNGGTSGDGNDGTHEVLSAEIWNPSTEQWTTVANQIGYRGYHSVALLLPDARVLVAGGEGTNTPPSSAQIYSPPYLFNGSRPVISSAPPHANYGNTFLVSTPNANSIVRVTLVRLGSVTHAFNQDQRFNSLKFSEVSGGLSVIAPATANLCPAGYYMLFLINSSGVPSVAAMINIS